MPSFSRCKQVVGRQVDDHHFVGLVEHPVGHRLPHPDAGDAADHVVQRLQVLHVDGGPDVDAGVEQLLDVLPALGMARAGHVGVRQLVDQDQCGLALQRRVDVELPERAVAVAHLLQRQDLEALDQRLGFRPAVRLGDADHDVGSQRALRARSREHRVGLADPCRGAEEDLQLAAARLRLLLLQSGQELVGIGALVGHLGKLRSWKL